MSLGEFGERKPGWNELPSVEVTEEQLNARMQDWMELAKANAGEPVITFKYYVLGCFESLQMGKVRSDLDQAPDTILEEAAYLADPPTVTSNGHGVQDSRSSVRIGFSEVYDSFQLKKTRVSDTEGAPCFQIVFGNEAIADWFTQNKDVWGLEPFRYVQMTRRLGIEPIMTQEIADSAFQYKFHTMARLVKLALGQSVLTERIDAVHKSIGSGLRSLHGGLAVSMAPESTGEANLRTHRQQQDHGRNNHTIQSLKQELVDLGVEETDYYRSVAWLLGLDLPASDQDQV